MGGVGAAIASPSPGTDYASLRMPTASKDEWLAMQKASALSFSEEYEIADDAQLAPLLDHIELRIRAG